MSEFEDRTVASDGEGFVEPEEENCDLRGDHGMVPQWEDVVRTGHLTLPAHGKKEISAKDVARVFAGKETGSAFELKKLTLGGSTFADMTNATGATVGVRVHGSDPNHSFPYHCNSSGKWGAKYDAVIPNMPHPSRAYEIPMNHKFTTEEIEDVDDRLDMGADIKTEQIIEGVEKMGKNHLIPDSAEDGTNHPASLIAEHLGLGTDAIIDEKSYTKVSADEWMQIQKHGEKQTKAPTLAHPIVFETEPAQHDDKKYSRRLPDRSSPTAKNQNITLNITMHGRRRSLMPQEE